MNDLPCRLDPESCLPVIHDEYVLEEAAYPSQLSFALVVVPRPPPSFLFVLVVYKEAFFIDAWSRLCWRDLLT